MVQWFIWLPEFAEFTEFPSHLGKSSLLHLLFIITGVNIYFIFEVNRKSRHDNSEEPCGSDNNIGDCSAAATTSDHVQYWRNVRTQGGEHIRYPTGSPDL